MSNAPGGELRDHLREIFVKAGFAYEIPGQDKLLPCPLGTFVNSSFSDLECLNCSAGKHDMMLKNLLFMFILVHSVVQILCSAITS